jgi:hypothetical protein
MTAVVDHARRRPGHIGRFGGVGAEDLAPAGAEAAEPGRLDALSPSQAVSPFSAAAAGGGIRR